MSFTIFIIGKVKKWIVLKPSEYEPIFIGTKDLKKGFDETTHFRGSYRIYFSFAYANRI